MANSYAMDMTTGSLFKKIVRFSVPIILANLLQILYNAADLIVVGQFAANQDAVGAVGATNALVSLLTNLFIGVSIGVNVVVAHAIGAQRKEEVKTIIGTATIIGAVCSVIGVAVGFFFSGTFLHWMGTPEALQDLAATYLRIYFFGVPALIFYNFFTAVLRAYGDTKRPLYFLILSGAINVVLNIFFVAGCSMDVEGVALATVISQYISAFLAFLVLLRSKDYCRFSRKHLKWNGYYGKKILTIGLPSGVYSTMFSFSNVIIQSAANSFGSAVVVKGMAAASSIEGFIYTPMNSVSVANTSFVSQNVGAKRFDRVRKCIRESLVIVVIAWLIPATTALFFRNALLSFYAPGDALAIEYGAARLVCMVSLYFLCGIMDTFSSTLRGMGKSMLCSIAGIVGVCGLRLAFIFAIFYPTKAYLSVNQSLTVLYSTYPVSWIVTAAVLMLLTYAEIRKREKKYNLVY